MQACPLQGFQLPSSTISYEPKSRTIFIFSTFFSFLFRHLTTSAACHHLLSLPQAKQLLRIQERLIQEPINKTTSPSSKAHCPWNWHAVSRGRARCSSWTPKSASNRRRRIRTHSHGSIQETTGSHLRLRASIMQALSLAPD